MNGQYSSWVDVYVGVPQGSILGPLLFLIYINDLSDGLKNECKLFADGTSLFSVVDDINTSTSDLNEDLEKISNWTFKSYLLNLIHTLIIKLKKLHLVERQLPHCTRLNTLIINQLNQHKYAITLG